MSIPDFTEDGDLPPGVHGATWREVCDRFGTNEHRRNLLGGLHAVLSCLQNAGCRMFYLDGSFVTSKPYPADFDGIWDPDGVTLELLDPVLLDFTNKQSGQKQKFRGEVFPNLPVGAHNTAFFELFQTNKGTGARKGIIAISLEELDDQE